MINLNVNYGNHTYNLFPEEEEIRELVGRSAGENNGAGRQMNTGVNNRKTVTTQAGMSRGTYRVYPGKYKCLVFALTLGIRYLYAL